MREVYTTGAVWEDKVGYARAVKIGNVIEISGTTSVADGKIVSKGDVFGQTKQIFAIAQKALAHFGADWGNVIRTRMYVKNIDDWEKISVVHAEVFGKIKPATTMVEVSRFIDEEILVEIEFTAIVE